MFEKGTNVLVTGGAGYVGAVLIPALLDRGYNVTSLDLMIYGDEVLDQHPNLKIVNGDLRDSDLLETLMTSVDLVIHLACISNDPSCRVRKCPTQHRADEYGISYRRPCLHCARAWSRRKRTSTTTP